MARILFINSRAAPFSGYADAVMKTSLKSVFSLAMALTFGALALSAQSCAVVDHTSKAVGHSAAASGEVSAAVVQSGAASGQAVTAVAAVPLWMSGAVVQGSGTVVASVGNASAQAGAAVTAGAEKMWDSATGDPAKRPALNRQVGVPAVPPTPVPAKRQDPPPAEALKLTQ